MQIIVNGEEREAPAGITVAAYVESLGFDPETVVVELNGQILARLDYGERRLAAGAELELIRFVGGG